MCIRYVSNVLCVAVDSVTDGGHERWPGDEWAGADSLPPPPDTDPGAAETSSAAAATVPRSGSQASAPTQHCGQQVAFTRTTRLCSLVILTLLSEYQPHCCRLRSIVAQSQRGVLSF